MAVGRRRQRRRGGSGAVSEPRTAAVDTTAGPPVSERSRWHRRANALPLAYLAGIVAVGFAHPLLLGLFRLATPETRSELYEVNGSLSLVVWEGEVLILVMNFEIVDDKITCIRNVINPEKLSFISHSPTPPVGSDIPATD